MLRLELISSLSIFLLKHKKQKQRIDNEDK